MGEQFLISAGNRRVASAHHRSRGSGATTADCRCAQLRSTAWHRRRSKGEEASLYLETTMAAKTRRTNGGLEEGRRQQGRWYSRRKGGYTGADRVAGDGFTDGG